MKKVNVLYEFMTPNGFLPFGYELKDLPIIFSEINDDLSGNSHRTTRIVKSSGRFEVSASTEDIFNVMSEYFEGTDVFNRVLVKDIHRKQLKNDYNLFVVTSLHNEPIIDYITALNFEDMFSKKAFRLFKEEASVKLVFIDNKEGGYVYPDKFFDNIYEFVNKNKLQSNKIIFITNTSDIKNIYENYLNRNNIPPFMICDHINFCVHGQPGKNIIRYENTTNNYEVDKIVERGTEYSISAAPHTNMREKHFLCLNRNSGRIHRPKLVLELIRNDIFDKGLVSLFKSQDFDNFCELPQNIHFKTHIKEKYPFIVDYEDADAVADMHNYFTKKEMWDKTYFSVVTESCTIKESVFITEKVVRPMIYFHPFIVYGNPNTLREVRNMGFETFPEFFDESYDTIEDENERLNAIIENVKKLCSLSLEELHNLYQSVYPKLVHNRNLLSSLERDNFVANKLLHLISL